MQSLRSDQQCVKRVLQKSSRIVRRVILEHQTEFEVEFHTRRKGSSFARTRTILRNSCTFEQFKDTQEVLSILRCKTNVLQPEGFTEKIYHVGNGKELRSMVNHGLIPGGVSLRTGRQAVFFTIVNPMAYGENLCDLSQARIAPYKRTWKRFFRIQYFGAIWSTLNKEDRNFIKQDQTQLFSTTHCLQSYWESDTHEDQGSALSKECVIQRPRVVLILKFIRKVVHKIYLYKKQDHLANRHKMRRATSKPEATQQTISTEKLQDARWPNDVTKLIEMFERHQHKEQFFEDMSRKQEINKFSEESQQLLVDMNHTEIFELCNVLIAMLSPKTGSFMAVSREIWKYSLSPTTLQKTNCDFTSIPGFVVKKNSSRGPKHGVSERQLMFYKAKEMLKKTRQSKQGRHPTILSRWYEQEGYRKLSAEQNTGEKEVMLFDRIALERRLYSYDSWAVTERRTLNSSFECWWASKASSTETRICRCVEKNALKCKTPTWRKRCNLWDRYVPNINNVNEKINNSKGEKTSITMSIGQRVGAHGIPHRLVNGGDFGFVDGIPENRRESRQDTRSKDTFVLYSLLTARTTQLMRMAQ